MLEPAENALYWKVCRQMYTYTIYLSIKYDSLNIMYSYNG